MGDYLINESLTPDTGKYPRFTRSTGRRLQFPQPADCGSQSDRPFEIEPDKGGIAGYALMRLFEASGEDRYLKQGLHNARVLAANQQPGDAFHSPWPFRADYRGGEGRGPVSGNMTYILRLFDAWLNSVTPNSSRRARRSGSGSRFIRCQARPPTARCSRSFSRITIRRRIAPPGRR